ncbi:MAG: GIY-YIG nuclease family protein [Oleiphilaceae bacterium]|nr:GIY-YIG nuclease family protein [Oleiphilaceae bacterium]
MSTTKQAWFVYIIETRCGLLYTGIATDVARRFEEHLARFEGHTKKGARFFNGREPVAIRYQERCANRSAASIREAQIKRLRVAQKRALMAAGSVT